MLFSIVIPTFNRAYCIKRAIYSACDFLLHSSPSEIVIVDDGSSDETITIVENIIKENIRPFIIIRLIKHQTNKGVCVAKNTGAKNSKGKWIIFLDSDDELLYEAYDVLSDKLNQYNNWPIHFFSCNREDDLSLNLSEKMEMRNFPQYLKHGTDGEKLPIIDREIFNEFLYDEDIPGYESLAYMRIIKKYEFACIHDLVVRRYYTSNSDRLSSNSVLWKRSGKLALGHMRVIFEHHRELGVVGTILYFLRIIRSLILWGFWNLNKK